MRKNLFIVLITCVLVLSACLEEYKVPVNQKTQQLVIEALLTDEVTSDLPSIKLSLTEQFGNTYSYKPVSGAFVQITDNEGKKTILQSVGSLQGVYQVNDFRFQAKVGKTYKLTVKLPDGRTYESPNEPMLTPVQISKLTAVFDNPVTRDALGIPNYRVFSEFQDPKNKDDFYRWNAWGVYKRKSTGVICSFGLNLCNERCWLKKEDFGVNLFSDFGVDGKLIRNKAVFESPIYFYGKHYIEITQFTISRGAYQFWQRFLQQTGRSGTIFDPIPAPISGNLVNIANEADVALGYFEVASIARKRLEIPGDTLQGKLDFEKFIIPKGDCSIVFPKGVPDRFAPPGW